MDVPREAKGELMGGWQVEGKLVSKSLHHPLTRFLFSAVRASAGGRGAAAAVEAGCAAGRLPAPEVGLPALGDGLGRCREPGPGLLSHREGGLSSGQGAAPRAFLPRKLASHLSPCLPSGVGMASEILGFWSGSCPVS